MKKKTAYPILEELVTGEKTSVALETVQPPESPSTPGGTASSSLSNADMMKKIGGSGTKMF